MEKVQLAGARQALEQLEKGFGATYFIIIGVKAVPNAEGHLTYTPMCLSNVPPPIEDHAIILESVVKSLREKAQRSKTQ